MSQENIEQLELFLLEEGWKKYPTYPPVFPEILRHLWCKQLSNVAECTSNEKLPQLTLNLVTLYIHENVTDYVIVDIKGEVDSAVWYSLQAYALSIVDFMAIADILEAKLSAAWQALHN